MDNNEKHTPEFYAGREQSLVKHEVLKQYLLRCALIVGRQWTSLTYIDGFSGPWNAQSDKLEDSSFSIALEQLRKARSKLSEQQLNLSLRCFFIEYDAKAYALLKQFADGVPDAVIETKNCEFESAIPHILEFVKGGGPKGFPFIFIDPTGWTGFAMKTIQPLLQLQPGEVLINFMTRHIKRFIDAPEQLRHDEFKALFGSDEYLKMPADLPVQDREDWLVNLYIKNLQKAGNFQYVCTVMVLHPEMDATHFHLIYATRHMKGVEVFKDAEKKAMEVQERARAEAQQLLRKKRGGQEEMFSAQIMHRKTHYESLRERYLSIAKSDLEARIRQDRSLTYDTAWTIALPYPLVWESDLKIWVAEWEEEKRLRVDGLRSKERVPKLGQSHRLVWLDAVGASGHMDSVSTN